MTRTGEAIRRARKQAGLTQDELAKAVGHANQSSVSHWERGTYPLKVTDAIAIARACGVDPVELLAEMAEEQIAVSVLEAIERGDTPA